MFQFSENEMQLSFDSEIFFALFLYSKLSFLLLHSLKKIALMDHTLQLNL